MHVAPSHVRHCCRSVAACCRDGACAGKTPHQRLAPVIRPLQQLPHELQAKTARRSLHQRHAAGSGALSRGSCRGLSQPSSYDRTPQGLLRRHSPELTGYRHRDGSLPAEAQRPSMTDKFQHGRACTQQTSCRVSRKRVNYSTPHHDVWLAAADLAPDWVSEIRSTVPRIQGGPPNRTRSAAVAQQAAGCRSSVQQRRRGRV